MKPKQLIWILLMVFLFSGTLNAQDSQISLWPRLAPGSEKELNEEQWIEGKEVIKVYQPELHVFLPGKRKESMPAILIIPGGGYRKVVMNKEGFKIAKWFNEQGIAAFVLKYRLTPEFALQDARRAMSIMRYKADYYGLNPDKIGAIGFSAGAHICGNLSFNYENNEYIDPIDSISSRPDYWIGVYGVYMDIVDKKKINTNKDYYPPAFLVHAGNDSKAPVSSSIELYQILKNNNIPAELHIYEKGEHGFALEKNRGEETSSTVKSWSKRVLEWLRLKKIIY